MAHTYSQMIVHIVFCPRGRQSVITEEHRDRIEKYISGIINNRKQKLLAIYCMPDHIHLLVSMRPDISVSDLVRDIKANSTKFIKAEKLISQFSWQTGFGCFTYSRSQSDIVINYIRNQANHHKKKEFREEYLDILNKCGIDFNERYLFEKPED
jgi:putative transposase